MILMCTTRVRLRSPLVFPRFAWSTARTFRRARSAHGNVFAEGRSDGWLVFWTLTGWTSPNALKTWVGSGLHAQVMKHAHAWFIEASVARWSADVVERNWQNAFAMMAAHGRVIV